MRLSDSDIQKLKDAITAAFQNNTSLGQLVGRAWAISLDDISPPVARPAMITEIIRYAMARDQAIEFIQAARLENNTSKVLASVGQKLLDKLARISRWPEPPTPFAVCFVEEESPLVNRTMLRDFCRDISKAGVPTVCIVNGPPLAGKTYSIGLMGYLRVAAHLDLAAIDFKEVPAPAQYTPEQLMQEIVRQAKWTIAPPGRASAGARYGEELVTWLIGQARESGTTLVVVLDNCHEPSLNAETRELVQQMVKQIAAQYSTGQVAVVRLILLNYPKELETQVSGPIHRESVLDLTPADVTQFITDFFAHRNTVPPAWVIEMFATKAWELAQKNGSNNPAVCKAVLDVANVIVNLP
jgi:Effector-associated domain 1